MNSAYIDRYPCLIADTDHPEQDEGTEFEDYDSDLTTLSSSVLDYEYENGRRYHSNRTVRLAQSRDMI